MATIRDIAKIAGVSTATVSHIINGKGNFSYATKEKIVAIMKELNYHPKENVHLTNQQPLKKIGLFIEGFTSGFYCKLQEGMFYACLENGCALQVFLSNLTGEALLNQILSTKLDGYVILNRKLPTNAPEILRNNLTPVVFLNREVYFDTVSSVLIDNVTAMERMIDYLVKCGYRKFGLMYGDRCYDDEMRIKGFRMGLEKYGIDLDERYVVSGGFNVWSGYHCMSEILPTLHPLPDVMVCTNDSMAWGCITALEEFGLEVPEDIAVTGFDGYYVAPDKKALTTIQNPAFSLAYKAVKELCRLIECKNGGSLIYSEAPLIFGDSTGVKLNK